MSSLEKTIIICLKVGDPDQYIYPGSIQVKCEDCGVSVYAAPSGQELIEKKGAIVVCEDCGKARILKQPGEFMTSEKQIHEIKAWRKRN